MLNIYRGLNYLYWRAIVRRWIGLLAVSLFMIFIVILILNLPLSFPAAQNLMVEGLYRILEWGDWSARDIICFAMPVLAWSEIEEDDVKSPPEMLLSSLGVVARVDMHSPAALLRSEIPLLAEIGPPSAAEIPVINVGRDSNGRGPVYAENASEFIKDGEIFDSSAGNDSVVKTKGSMTRTRGSMTETKTSRLPDYMAKNLVAVYNTHTGETYALTDGVERLDGKRGGVVAVAEALERALKQKYGIMVARSDKIHDEEYNTSYLKSEKTARKLIKDNPHLRAVIDVHRDISKPREYCVVKINGKNVARIMLIVGSDRRAPHPNWKDNYNFAKELADKMDKMYPGLCEGVRVQDGRYNQFLHPRAVLVEMGGVNNYTEEAIRAAELFADVLAEVIMEQTVL